MLIFLTLKTFVIVRIVNNLLLLFSHSHILGCKQTFHGGGGLFGVLNKTRILIEVYLPFFSLAVILKGAILVIKYIKICSFWILTSTTITRQITINAAIIPPTIAPTLDGASVGFGFVIKVSVQT